MLGLLLNVAPIILSCIFLILLSDFRARRLRSIPSLAMLALTEFFLADVGINVHPLPVFYFYFTMMVSVFLYAYYVYIMLCCRCCQLR